MVLVRITIVSSNSQVEAYLVVIRISSLNKVLHSPLEAEPLSNSSSQPLDLELPILRIRLLVDLVVRQHLGRGILLLVLLSRLDGVSSLLPPRLAVDLAPHLDSRQLVQRRLLLLPPRSLGNQLLVKEQPLAQVLGNSSQPAVDLVSNNLQQQSYLYLALDLVDLERHLVLSNSSLLRHRCLVSQVHLMYRLVSLGSSSSNHRLPLDLELVVRHLVHLRRLKALLVSRGLILADLCLVEQLKLPQADLANKAQPRLDLVLLVALVPLPKPPLMLVIMVLEIPSFRLLWRRRVSSLWLIVTSSRSILCQSIEIGPLKS